MKKLILIVLFSFANAFFLIAQPSIQWQKCLGGTAFDYAYSVQQTADSGYIVAGYSTSNDGDVTGNHGIGYNDYWLVKLNSIGIIQWQKCLGGTGNDYACSIQQTSDSGFIIAGFSGSIDGDVTGNHGDFDYWVVKINSGGTIQWQKCLGGTGNDLSFSIQQTIDSGYIVAGVSESNNGNVVGNHGGSDYWVVKLNNTGTIQWQKCLGGNGEDKAFSIQQTKDAGYIVAGYSSSNDGDVTGNHGNEDFWVVKLNSAGTILWKKCLGGTGYEEAKSIQQTSDSGFIVAGSSGSNDGDVSGNHGNGDYWIVKLNGTGNIQWQKCLGGTYGDNAMSIQQTIDNGYVVVGFEISNNGDVTGNQGLEDYWVAKLSSSGIIQWQKCLGGTDDDFATLIQQTSDMGFIVAGYSKSSNGDVTGNHGGIYDYWIVKLNPNIIGISEINNPISNLQLIPNPVSQSTLISFSLFQSENISVTVYDITGRLVKNLFDGNLNGGLHEINWNVAEEGYVDGGVYLLNIRGERFTQSCKLVIVK